MNDIVKIKARFSSHYCMFVLHVEFWCSCTHTDT